MALKRRTMNVYVLDESNPEGYSEHTIDLLLADQMRGELEVKKRGLKTDYSINLGAAMAWACMARLGLTTHDLDNFALECISIQDTDEDDEDEDVDPTPPAASSDSA